MKGLVEMTLTGSWKSGAFSAALWIRDIGL